MGNMGSIGCVCVSLCKCMSDFYRTPPSIMQIFRKCISMFSVIPVSTDKFQTIALRKHEEKIFFQIWNWWVIFGQDISINHVPSCWQNVSISIRRCYRIQTICGGGYHVPLMTLNSRVQVPWFPPRVWHSYQNRDKSVDSLSWSSFDSTQ